MSRQTPQRAQVAHWLVRDLLPGWIRASAGFPAMREQLRGLLDHYVGFGELDLYQPDGEHMQGIDLLLAIEDLDPEDRRQYEDARARYCNLEAAYRPYRETLACLSPQVAVRELIHTLVWDQTRGPWLAAPRHTLELSVEVGPLIPSFVYVSDEGWAMVQAPNRGEAERQMIEAFRQWHPEERAAPRGKVWQVYLQYAAWYFAHHFRGLSLEQIAIEAGQCPCGQVFLTQKCHTPDCHPPSVSEEADGWPSERTVRYGVQQVVSLLKDFTARG